MEPPPALSLHLASHLRPPIEGHGQVAGSIEGMNVKNDQLLDALLSSSGDPVEVLDQSLVPPDALGVSGRLVAALVKADWTLDMACRDVARAARA